MLIYTPVPPEVLWSLPEKEEIKILGGMVQGIPVTLKVVAGESTAVVERVLSTDPAHFLESSCQPGCPVIP